MLKIKIQTEGLTEKEASKVEMARLHISRAVNSVDFQLFVNTYSWDTTYTVGRFWNKRTVRRVNKSFSTNVFSNQTVFNKIMSGYETLSPGIDSEADINIKIDRKNKTRVLGYTYASTKWQWVYRVFFGRSTVKSLAGNLFHEYLHKQGFRHDRKFTTRRPYSVPYAVGYFVRDFIG